MKCQTAAYFQMLSLHNWFITYQPHYRIRNITFLSTMLSRSNFANGNCANAYAQKMLIIACFISGRLWEGFRLFFCVQAICRRRVREVKELQRLPYIIINKSKTLEHPNKSILLCTCLEDSETTQIQFRDRNAQMQYRGQAAVNQGPLCVSCINRGLLRLPYRIRVNTPSRFIYFRWKYIRKKRLRIHVCTGIVSRGIQKNEYNNVITRI